jgi:hypothetical protein
MLAKGLIMYLHAKGQNVTSLSRPDWRVIARRDIEGLLDTDRSPFDLDMPVWLKDEVKRFTPEKWLFYWDERTGRRAFWRVEKPPAKVGKSPKSITGENLYSKSKREVAGRPIPSSKKKRRR